MTISLSCLLISNFCHKLQNTIQMMNKLKTIQLYNFDLLIKVISWADGSFKRGDFIWYKII